jgi:hypothetical protein
MGRLLEIQLPKIFVESKNHRTIAMEGRLYKHGLRGLALFTPNPLTNQQCISFELKQLSKTRLHVLCKANKFAIEHFREVVTKIEKNWTETKESVKRFLATHKGETVIPIISMGPTINTLTGEIVPEPERFHRAEYKFKGSPVQFSIFITNYGKILADKHKSDIVDLIEPTSSILKDIPQARAMFFPIDHLDFEQQKGVFGEITAQSLPNQTSLLKVEAQSHVWGKVQTTWEVILTELKRQGWISSDEEQDTQENKKAGVDINGNVADSAIVIGNHNIVYVNPPTENDNKKSDT